MGFKDREQLVGDSCHVLVYHVRLNDVRNSLVGVKDHLPVGVFLFGCIHDV